MSVKQYWCWLIFLLITWLKNIICNCAQQQKVKTNNLKFKICYVPCIKSIDNWEWTDNAIPQLQNVFTSSMFTYVYAHTHIKRKWIFDTAYIIQHTPQPEEVWGIFAYAKLF